MVILLGGSSHVGKTLTAQKLMERLSIPYISQDHIKMAMIRAGMLKHSVTEDYALRYEMWPFMTELIKTVVENRQNLILEGCYIPAEWQKSFTQEYLPHIKSVFLTMSETYLRTHADDVTRYANVIEQRICDEVDLERLINCSKGFYEDCVFCGIPVYEIDGTYDIDAIVNGVLDLLELE